MNKSTILNTLSANAIAVLKKGDQEVTMLVSDVLSKLDANGSGFIEGLGQVTLSSVRKNPLEIRFAEDKLIIEKASIVDQLTSMIQKRSKGLVHPQIILRSITQNNQVVEFDNEVKYVKVPENLAVRKGVFAIEDHVVFRHGKDSTRFNKDSAYAPTLEIISVSYNEDEEQGNDMIRGDLWMSMDQYGAYSFFIKHGSIYRNIETDERRTSNEGLRRYQAFGASPSNDRQKVIYFIDVTNGVEKANNTLDVLTHGAYKLSFGKMVSFEKLAKLSSRWFQWMAPCTSLGEAQSIAIYHGKFNNDRLDGLAFSLSEGLASVIEKKMGYAIDPRSLDGVFWQGRPVQTKAGFLSINPTMMHLMMNSLDAAPVQLNWDQVDAKFSEDCEAGVFNGRLTILGEGTPELLVDMNGLKSYYDMSIKPEWNVLRFLRCNPSNFSSTIMQKMVFKDEAAAQELATELLASEVFARLNRNLLNPEAKVLSPERFGDNLFMDEVLQSVFPTYVSMDRNIGMKVLANNVMAVNKMLHKIKVPMQGYNSGLTPTVESLFGLDSLLGNHEVLCPKAEKEYKKLGVEESKWEMFVIKYPSMDVNEYSIQKIVSRKEMKNRIKALPISKELKAELIHYYMTLHDSVIVVPGCELWKNQHAGSDFDTDQVCWSMNAKLIDIMRHEPVAIVID